MGAPLKGTAAWLGLGAVQAGALLVDQVGKGQAQQVHLAFFPTQRLGMLMLVQH